MLSGAAGVLRAACFGPGAAIDGMAIDVADGRGAIDGGKVGVAIGVEVAVGWGRGGIGVNNEPRSATVEDPIGVGT